MNVDAICHTLRQGNGCADSLLADDILQQPTAGLKQLLFGEFQHGMKSRTTRDTITVPKNTKTSRSWIPNNTSIHTEFKFNLRNPRGDPTDWLILTAHQPNYQL